MSDWKKLISDAKELLDIGAITDAEFEEAKQKAFALRDGPTTQPSPPSDIPNLDDMGTRIHSPSSATTNPLPDLDDMRTMMGNPNTLPPDLDDMGTMLGSPNTLPPGFNTQDAAVGSNESETIGSYRIVELLGQGGMGSVYRGRHKNDQVAKARGDVAIKMIHPNLANDEGFKTRFVKEGLFGMSLQHPNIAKVTEVIDEQGLLAVVMEYIDGQELKDMIPKDGMPVEEVVRLLKPIASALDHLHDKGIVHRDMKPANVRVKPDGTPVILDFGIAKDTNEADSGMTQTGTAMGTQTYMAPEQMDAKRVTGKADQYALAMMAYQMLSGKLPWAIDESNARITVVKMTGELKELSQVYSTSFNESNVVMKGLSLNAENRYSTCNKFVSALSTSSKQQRGQILQSKSGDLHVEAFSTHKISPMEDIEDSKEVTNSMASASKTPFENQGSTRSKSYLSKPIIFGVSALLLSFGTWFIVRKDTQDESTESFLSVNNSRSSISQSETSRAVEQELKRLGIEMVDFESNSEIEMGSTYDEVGRDNDEETTTASIDYSFSISDAEITQLQYKKVMGTDPAKDRHRYWGKRPSKGEACAKYGVGDNFPVHCISWLDAIQFCNELSQRLGLEPVYTVSNSLVERNKNANGFRLPTEVEWVYAARGPKRDKAYLSSSSDNLCEYANVSNNGTRNQHPEWTRRGILSCQDSWDALAPVRSQRPVRNLYDMTGNLWEWTWSKYSSNGPNVQFSSSVSLSSHVVLRGGAWQGPSADYRLANRYSQLPDRHSFFVGFRIARNQN